MGRTVAPLKPEALEPALTYLQRASARSSDVYKDSAHVSAKLAELRRALPNVPEEARPQLLHEWLLKHVTPRGRVRMLNALRRARADANSSKNSRRTLVLSAGAHNDLVSLAAKTGMPTTKALSALVAIAHVDSALREQMIRLAVASAVGRAMASSSARPPAGGAKHDEASE